MTNSELAGRAALVTGGARGIGLRIAERLARAGAAICIADNNADAGARAKALLQENGGSAELLVVDLARVGAPQQAVKSVVERHGRIDVLVNNARSGMRLGVLEETEVSWAETLSVTLRAAFFASQEALRHMGSQKSGSIVNISSVAGLLATPESPSYHVAKAGIVQMTRYLAVAGGAYGVRVNSILPGFIVQDEHIDRFQSASNAEYRKRAELYHPLGTVGDASDVAELVHFLCTEAAKYISGENIVLDGAATKQEQFGLLSRIAQVSSRPREK